MRFILQPISWLALLLDHVEFHDNAAGYGHHCGNVHLSEFENWIFTRLRDGGHPAARVAGLLSEIFAFSAATRRDVQIICDVNMQA